jgi:SAM-dependent methyltransferase
MNQLLEAYSGDKARNYDARRATSKRWRREVEAMESMLADVRPSSVVDCPFGTGRWIEQYEKIGAQVTAIDLSQAMLDEAQSKIAALPETRRTAYNLVCQSIFNLEPLAERRPDLTVCIRFLNWVEFPDAERALQRLSDLGSPVMIVGASLVPAHTGPLRRLWYRLSLGMINLRGRKRPKQYVHAEDAFLALLDRLGWRVIDRRKIMSRNARVNYFFRLERV